MENNNLRLEQIVKDAIKTKNSKNCNYCTKPIKPEKAFKSPAGNLYCNENCYIMFTED